MSSIQNTQHIKGITEKRLFNTKKFYELLKIEGAKFSNEIELNILFGKYNLTNIYEEAIYQVEKNRVDALLDESAKKLFKSNFIGNLLLKRKLDIKIPLLTGYFTLRPLVSNLVTTRGKQVIAEQVNGVTTAPVTAIALGTGTTAAAAGDTTLETEITDSGGERGSATASSVTTSTTKDTSQWVKTFNFTGSKAVTEEGLLDNNTSGGNLLARQVFSAINVADGDSLQITHKIQYT